MAIDYLIPDMPSAEELLPFLHEIDQNRYYSNFGPLHRRFKTGLCDRFFPCLTEGQVTLVASGTVAIEVALRSLQLDAGSEVLVPVYTFPATAQAVVNCGLKPVFADIDREMFQLTPKTASELMSRQHFAAVLPVAVAGIPVNAKAWAEFSYESQIPVVVDAASALGNQPIEAGLLYAFSLHATKAFGIGEGGVVVDSRPEVVNLAPRTNFGFDGGRIVVQGGNYKVSEYHCAVGLAQLNRFEQLLSTRKTIYQFYVEQLEKVSQWISWQKNPCDVIPSNLIVNCEAVSAKELHAGLSESGVISRRLFWPLLCDHDFNFSDQKKSVFPAAYEVSEQWLSLPYHNFLSKDDITYVIEKILEINGSKLSRGSIATHKKVKADTF